MEQKKLLISLGEIIELTCELVDLFSPPYNPVVYCYGANQPTTFERMKKNKASVSKKAFQIPHY